MCNNKQKKRNNNNNKRSIITTLVVLAVCLVIVTGSTFSLFTSSTGVNIAITAANVQLVATIDETSIKYYSMDAYESNVKFENGGSADVVDGTITIDNITPGDKLTFDIKLNNTSTIDIQYRVKWTVEGALAGALKATAGTEEIKNGSSKWTSWLESEADENTIKMAIEFPTDLFADKTAEERQKLYNDLQGKSANINLVVEAVQGNADMPDVWSGDVPSTMPSSLVVDGATQTVHVKDAAAFAYLSTLSKKWVELYTDGNGHDWTNYANGAGADYYYSGYWTISLEADIDLDNQPISPIYIAFGEAVGATAFNGNNHVISNINTTTGLFADNNRASYANLVLENVKATNGALTGFARNSITNVTVKNATISGVDYVGGLVGYMYSNVTNCKVVDSSVVGVKEVGGLIGYIASSTGLNEVKGNEVNNVTVHANNRGAGLVAQVNVGVKVLNNTVKDAIVEVEDTRKYQPGEIVSNNLDSNNIYDNTVENVTCGIRIYGLKIVPNGENSKIIVNDKEGFLNLTKLFADWTALFTDGNGNEWGNYANGAGVDYYYAGRWTVSLEADIDLNNATIDPVTIKHPVRAGDPTFDGNNHTISNAKIVADATVESMTGLFNVTNEAFKNLKLDNIHVTGSNVGNSSAGILAGYCSGRIDNITITNSSVTGGKYTGGVVGSGYTDISNCTLTNVTVKGGYKLGGIIGYICAETGYTHNVTGNTLTDCTVDGIGGGVFAGGKTEYVIGQVVGNYNCNGTCNNNTITGMTSSVTDAIGKIEAGKTVTQ